MYFMYLFILYSKDCYEGKHNIEIHADGRNRMDRLDMQDGWKNFEKTGQIAAYLQYKNSFDTIKESEQKNAECRQAGDAECERFCFGDGNGPGNGTCK